MIENAATGALENFNFEQLQKYIPELQKFNFPIDTYQFDPPMDSSDMEPDMWRKLVRIIHDNYNRYHGFVILHGTDTMAYTASALSFMLEGLDKPVILTGSQLPIGVLRTDGKENLMTSIEIAIAQNKEGRTLVPEVCIFFENHLMRGNRTTKMNAENFNAFRSFNYPVLAEAGIHIKYNNVQIHGNGEERELKPHYLLDTNVVVLKLFPGIQENVIATILGIEGLKAVVLETYGSGNAPRKEWFIHEAASGRCLLPFLSRGSPLWRAASPALRRRFGRCRSRTVSALLFPCQGKSRGGDQEPHSGHSSSGQKSWSVPS